MYGEDSSPTTRKMGGFAWEGWQLELAVECEHLKNAIHTLHDLVNVPNLVKVSKGSF